MSTIAIVCNTGLGNGILFERLANALERQSRSCVVYSDSLLKLANLYPNIELRPYPQNIEDPNSPFWDEHVEYIFQQYAPGSCVRKLGRPIRVLGESFCKKSEGWAEHLISFLKNSHREFYGNLESSIQPPNSWQYRANRSRIVIYPAGLDMGKNWPAKKFLRLACKLKERGWSVEFCSTDIGKGIWDSRLEQHMFPVLSLKLEELAQYIYESGYFISNESGIAHLASALKIPSLKLFSHASRAHFWSGGWPMSKVVFPWTWLPEKICVRSWKILLSTSRVLRHFEELHRKFP